MFPSRRHLPAPLGSTVVTRFIATTRALTPAPLPLSTEAGLLDSLTCTSGHSVSNHPMRPCPGHASGSGQALPPIRLWSLSAVLRTSFIPSSLISRIRPNRVCVATPCRYRVSTDYPFTSSCSPPRVATTQLLSVTRREAPPVRNFHSLCTLALKRTRPGPLTRRGLRPVWGGAPAEGSRPTLHNSRPTTRGNRPAMAPGEGTGPTAGDAQTVGLREGTLLILRPSRSKSASLLYRIVFPISADSAPSPQARLRSSLATPACSVSA